MSSSSACDKLKRILLLEKEQGYNDRAIIGGLDRYMQFWERQAREELGAEFGPHIGEVGRALADYGDRSHAERRSALQTALTLLANGCGTVPHERPAERRVAEQPEKRATPRPQASRPSPKTESSGGEGLAASIQTLSGVGPARAQQMARLGIETIRDLIYHFPRRYDDFGQLKQINQLNLGEEVTVVGVVRKAENQQTGQRRNMLRVTLSDGTGVIECTWFNQPHLQRTLRPGTEIAVSGQVGEFLGRLVFTSPQWEPLQRDLLHTGRLVPVYALTEGLPMRWLRTLIRDTLRQWVPRIMDPMPQEILDSADLIDLRSAIMQVHFPESREALAQARTRLCFDELLLLQLGVLRKRHEWRQENGRALAAEPAVIQEFVQGLPFALTGAQERAIQELLHDMAQPVPMSRLLQGDVGSGKTVVAVAAMLAAVRSGYQAALMAPTSILAEQHAASVQGMLAGYPDVRCALLHGGLPNAEKERIRQEVAEGEAAIVIGTHALIQDTVDFDRLALAIVDEQHRFGVLQRDTLRDKGVEFMPHMLAMSATPIPRTLALTVYGDLDVSTLDELPPNRQPVITAVRTPRSRERIYAFIRSQVEQGRQAFVICPLVEESDQIEARAAVEEYERLSREIFPHFRVGLLHGRVGAEEKERVMAAFKAGEYNILVSTAVVEVGVDIPNATVMLIEGAERFGLAQLHQFRGRVGRGAHRSYCILLTDSRSEENLARLRVMEETTDGFVLAEKDLELRGPGDFLGVRQHGLPELKVAQLGDVAVLALARREALRIHEKDPNLALAQHKSLAHSVDHFWASVTLA
jgi:ATP-dependent DNA helicase RecG